MNTGQRTKQMILAALLTAIAVIIPLIMPVKIIMPPFTATLASHVPIIISMFISPLVAAFVALGSALGFLLTPLGAVVTLRALMHVPFAVVGGYMISKKQPIWLVFIITVIIHTIAEILISVLLIADGQTYEYVCYIIGVGVPIHYFVDFVVSIPIIMALSKAKLGISPLYFKKH